MRINAIPTSRFKIKGFQKSLFVRSPSLSTRRGVRSSAERADSTLRSSRAVSHPSTNRALPKKRFGATNGNCALELDRYVTWKPTPVLFETFLFLLGLMHRRRLAGAQRPWLKVSDIPVSAAIPIETAEHVIEVMTESKFGHPDRFQDNVSKEVLSCMRRADTTEEAVAISIAVRYKSSGRGLARQLLSTDKVKFKRLVEKVKNGIAYEQTGLTKKKKSPKGSWTPPMR